MIGIKNHLHLDFVRYRRAVKTDNGSVNPNTQIELNRFIKWCYGLGLRDSRGIDNVFWDAAIFATETEAGYKNKIWFKKGSPSKLIGSATYEKQYGARVNLNANLVPGVDANEFDYNDIFLCALCHTYHPQRDIFGYNNGNSNRLSININLFYNNNTGIYFSCGGESSTNEFSVGWRFFGNGASDREKEANAISITGLGYIGGKKKGTISRAFVSNKLITARTNLSDTITPQTGEMRYLYKFRSDAPNNIYRYYTGHIFGKHINDSLTNLVYTRLNIIQNTIDARRLQYENYFPPLDEVDTAITSNSLIRPSFWHSPSIELQNLNAIPDSFELAIGGQMIKKGLQPLPVISSSGGLKYLQYGSSRGLKYEGLKFATNVMIIVFRPYEIINHTTAAQTLFALWSPGSRPFPSVGLGSYTSAMINEFLTYAPVNIVDRALSTNQRTYLDAVSRHDGNEDFGGYIKSFNANTDYIVIFYMSGSNPLIRVNGDKSDSNKNYANGVSNNRASGLNLDIGIGQDNNRSFNGEIKEILGFDSDIGLTEIRKWETYLINKWNITRRFA